MAEDQKLLEVTDLETHFILDDGVVRAVDGASFDVLRGRTTAIVGESGCGKSVTAQSILRIVPVPGKIIGGQMNYYRHTQDSDSFSMADVIDLAQMDPRGHEIREIRGNEIAMVFQEPMTSLSPVHTMGNQIMEAILLHQEVSTEEARQKAIDMLDRVGMPRPAQCVDSYPFELSGGMRQRGMIAMALSCNPSLLIADEPTTALDVTTEAQILDLMRQLQADMGMAIMYITHNLGVVAEIAEEVVVMYLGEVVERADVDTVFHNPMHPYTSALLKSIPRIEQARGRRLEAIKGMVPDPFSLPTGCKFNPRCSRVYGLCRQEDPPLIEAEPGHWVRCHLYA